MQNRSLSFVLVLNSAFHYDHSDSYGVVGVHDISVLMFERSRLTDTFPRHPVHQRKYILLPALLFSCLIPPIELKESRVPSLLLNKLLTFLQRRSILYRLACLLAFFQSHDSLLMSFQLQLQSYEANTEEQHTDKSHTATAYDEARRYAS